MFKFATSLRLLFLDITAGTQPLFISHSVLLWSFILPFFRLYHAISFHTIHYFNCFYMHNKCRATFTIYFWNITTLFQISTKQTSTKPKPYRLSLLASHTTFSLLYSLAFYHSPRSFVTAEHPDRGDEMLYCF